jgi:hypothetical protein
MAIPTARVKIEILNLIGLAPKVMAGADTRYATAVIQAGAGPKLVTGRSRPIPDAGGTFDLSAEAVPWVFEVSLVPGTSISINVKIQEDRGDSAPPAELVVPGTISDPWKSGVNTFGAAPGISVRVTTTLINPVDKAYLARAAASGISGALVVPQGFIVQIVDILGLYKPVPPAPPPARGSAHVAGYISEDNLGRVFTNRIPDGTWKRDTQFVEVKAKILAFGAPKIPAGAKIRWTLVDPDDPTNDSSLFHRDWGPYVDVNDYDGAGKSIGAHAGDNLTAHSPLNADESKLFGAGVSGSARWATATGGLAPSPSSSSQAESPLTLVNPKTATASVRIHCMNVLGTNLILKAELIGTPAGIPIHNATTGVITMWSRIDVEVKRMGGAFSLARALPTIPPFFLPACVQLDFRPQQTVPGPLNLAAIAATEDLEDTASASWVNSAFSHNGKGGWFFLGAARLASPLPGGASPPPLFDNTTYTLGTTGTQTWVQVAGALADPSFVRFNWVDGAGKQQSAGFGVRSFSAVGGDTRIVLWGNDVTPLFTGHDADGSIRHAMLSKRMYFPRHELPPGAGALSPGGFGVPAAGARVRVLAPGAVFTDGISPPLTDGGEDYFAGRTIIFTATPSHAASFVPPPDKPVLTRVPAAGSFPAARDVYVAITFVNGRGETTPSSPAKWIGTSASDQFSIASPILTPWHTALAGANKIKGYNIYEADVATGAPPPHAPAFKKVNGAKISIGTPETVSDTAAGAAPPATNTAAISPSVPESDFDDGVIETVVHEFIHAFGMPHKCGYWNWRTPREHSCCMNYFNTWLVGPAPAFHLLPNTIGKQGNDMCGRHLMEVRRVHLERNTALKNSGW